MKLHIGTNARGTQFNLPLELVTTSLAILAKKRVGKSYTAAVFAEELMQAGQPVCIIDITGAHWGLKASADGRTAGYPVVIFGGRHADVPLEENAGEIVARAIVEQRFSAILDFSIMSKSAMKRFLTAFLEEFYRINQEPIHLICDEADRYAPQQPIGDEIKLVAAMDDIVSRGGIKGIGVSIISQRSAKVNKNIVTQCELLVALRIVHPLDAKTIMEWVEMHATKTEAAEMLASLPTLPIGTAWFWWPGAPGGDIFERVKIRERTTFDSGATPKPGETRRQPKVLAEIDVAKLGQAIAATVERAKADDPKLLRAEIARLKKAVPTVTATKEVRVEVSVLSQDEINLIRSGIAKVGLLHIEISKIDEHVGELVKSFNNLAGRCATRPQQPVHSASKMASVSATKVQPVRPIKETPDAVNGTLSGAERKVLTVLAQHQDGCDKGKLALLSGYTYSGGFRNILSSLRSNSYIEGGNEQVMRITNAGDEALGPYDLLPTGSALANYWLTSGKLSGAESKVLEILLGFPTGLSAQSLAEAAGYEYSGGFRNILSTLRTAGVITGKNTETLKASENLFD